MLFRSRSKARRTLTERHAKADIRPALAAWRAKQSSDLAKLEALWMRQSIDDVQPALLNETLASSDGRIRAASVRVASFWQSRLDKPVDLLAKFVADEHPRVRMEALRALGKIPSARSAELALSAADKPLDKYLEYALWLTVNELAQPWIDSVLSGAWKMDGREKQLEYALKAIEPAQASKVMARIFEKQSIQIGRAHV